MSDFEVGVYTPTQAFSSIPEHVCIYRTRNRELVALIGPVGDPETMRLARLFCHAEEMVAALERARDFIKPLRTAGRGPTMDAISVVLAKVQP